MEFKLGLKPPRPGAIKLRLATYLDFNTLPQPTEVFGHYGIIGPGKWGMLANDRVGDCACAGACHQTMLWTAEAGNEAPFDDAAALGLYSAITGYNPNATEPDGENPTDQGTDIADLANYWQRSGINDASNHNHKVVAVVDLNPGDLRELWTATYLFGSVGLGFQMPQSAMDQTKAHKPWDVVEDDGGIQGGHYVPAVGRTANGNGVLITWGLQQAFTPAFYQKYSDQGIVALSEEMLVNGASIDGFDDALLRADLAALR